jgi:6-phosphogluconolactonase (cycloisomerase 2 family)
MNRTYRALGLAACFVLCFSFLVGCGGGNGVTLTGVAVTPASASIAAGATQQFTATGMYSDNSTKDLTSSATWASSSTSVATIAASGLATAVATGSSNITATAAGKTSAPATLTVTAPTVVSIAVTPATASIVVGNTQQFTATATYSDKSTKDITSTANWNSATPAVASISMAGGLATGLAAGTSAITAASGGVTSSPAATLTVTATGVPVSLVIQDVKSTTPTAPTVSVASTVPFTVLELYNDGTTHAPSAPATLAWTSVTTSTATIGAANGIAVAVAAGTSEIDATETVSAGTLKGKATLTVVAAAARFAFNADFNSTLTEWSVVPASGTFTAVTPAAATNSSQQVLVHPSGHFVYTVNYNCDLVLSTINSTTGIVTPVTNGTFTGAGQPGTAKAAIDPTGRFLYEVFYVTNPNAAAMFSFSIDQTSGALTPVTSPTTVFTTPSDILVDNTGNFAYVIDSGDLTTQVNGTVFAFQIDQVSGALTTLAAMPSITTGDLTPFFGAIDPANKNLYVANETSISIFAIAANGVLSTTAPIKISGGQFLQSIAITPSGKFLYVSDTADVVNGSGVHYGTLFGLTLNTDGSIANNTSPLSYPIGPSVGAFSALPWGVSIDPTSSLVTVDINSGSTLAVFNINADGSLTTDTAVPVNVPASSTGGSLSTFLTFYTAAPGQ